MEMEAWGLPTDYVMKSFKSFPYNHSAASVSSLPDCIAHYIWTPRASRIIVLHGCVHAAGGTAIHVAMLVLQGCNLPLVHSQQYAILEYRSATQRDLSSGDGNSGSRGSLDQQASDDA